MFDVFSCSRVLDKLIVAQLANEFTYFYGTRNLITVLTRARHWTILSQMNTILILTSYLFKIHLRLGLQSGLFPPGFLTKILYASLMFP
jgi:hypothetical protein